MPTPKTADEFLQIVEQSELLPAEVWQRYTHLGDPSATATRMVEDRVLTTFQAKQMLAGRYKGFIVADKYKLLTHLGSGGMGHVYLCEHLLLHRLVAIKRLALSSIDGFTASTAAARFLREARAVAAVDAPYIVKVFDMDQDGNLPFLVMEYIDGTNLHELVASHGPLSAARAAEYTRQAALGLQSAHEAGLVHRDIKPGNLLLDRQGVVHILDLGLARFFADPSKNANLTGNFDNNSVIGTAEFISPEQANDSTKVDIRSDIYALGCTLYYLLTGEAPFEEGTATQKLLAHQTREPAPIGKHRVDVPEGLVNVLKRMMRKDPAERYAVPRELAQALEKLELGPVNPPDKSEMPRVPASAYRLGLTPTGHTAHDIEAVAINSSRPPSEIFHFPVIPPVQKAPSRPGLRKRKPIPVQRSPIRGPNPMWWVGIGVVSALILGAWLGWMMTRP